MAWCRETKWTTVLLLPPPQNVHCSTSVVPAKHRRRRVDAVVAFKPFIADDRVKNPTFHFTSKFANNWQCSQKRHKLLLLQITIAEEWDCPIWEIPVS
jgi:hypothetical protein